MALSLGLVVSSSGRHCVVQDEQGRRWVCHTRARRQDAVVGDTVQWSPSGDGGVVEAVSNRRNLLMRQDLHRTKAFAANLDAMLFVVAVQPSLNESQLARALLAAHEAQVQVTLVLNKIDLPQAVQAQERLAPYRAMGVAVVELSVREAPEQATQALLPLLRGRTTLLLGASGVGKSSLINLLVPDAQARTAELSQALQSGRHTTTRTTWHALPGLPGSALIDSPGFQSFGLHHLQPAHLAAAMPDLAAFLGRCRFLNCSHLHEPGCGLREAVEQSRVSPTRWRIYKELVQELSRSPARAR